MKKLVILSIIGIMSTGMFATVNSKEVKMYTMKKYEIYCNGVLVRYAWASSQQAADAIAHSTCNG